MDGTTRMQYNPISLLRKMVREDMPPPSQSEVDSPLPTGLRAHLYTPGPFPVNFYAGDASYLRARNLGGIGPSRHWWIPSQKMRLP
jgi:hypothetical protein